MKLFLCVIIVFISGMVGITLKNKIYQKYQLFFEIHAFLQYISIKIAFFQDKYADCLQNFINLQQLYNKKFFNNLLKLIQSGQYNREKCLDVVKNINLTNEEENLIDSVFAAIGSTDIQSQCNIINGHILEISHKLKTLEEQKKTKGDVISKISICIGLTICILIY